MKAAALPGEDVGEIPGKVRGKSVKILIL